MPDCVAWRLERLLAAFERFLKELAATCIQHLAGFALDDRLDQFSTTGSAVVAHFESGTVGRALSESDTWLSCDTINKRFKKLLSDPFGAGQPFWIFPGSKQQPTAEVWRLPIMATLFQVRHTLVHNLGVLTGSDAARLRRLSRSPVDSDKVLSPTRRNFDHAKRFVDETAVSVNGRVAARLAELLTSLEADGYLTFDAQATAQELADAFQTSITVSGTTRQPA